MTDMTPEIVALGIIEDYFESVKFVYRATDTEIDIALVMGTYGTHEVNITAHEEGIRFTVCLSEVTPYNSDDLVRQLADVTSERIAVLTSGTLEWALSLDPGEISSFDDVQSLISCISREVFLTEAILDLFDQEGRSLDVYSAVGFGDHDEYDAYN